MFTHDVQAMAVIITKLNLHFPRSGGLLAEQILNLAEDWAEDLAEYPMPVIRQAMKLCRRDEGRKFFPTLGEFIGYCRCANVEYRRFSQRQIEAPSQETMADLDERNRLHVIDGLKSFYASKGWTTEQPEPPQAATSEPSTPSVPAADPTANLTPEQIIERAKLIALRDLRKKRAFQQEAVQ